MDNSFERLLRLAELYYENGEMEELNKLSCYFGTFMKKNAHFIPDKDSKTPEFFKKNLDYDKKEDSPYFGNVKEFLKKYPGGIMDWLKSRKKKTAEFLCPICNGKIIRNCRCKGPHTLELVKKGHGPVCENGHRISLEDGAAFDKNDNIIYFKDKK